MKTIQLDQIQVQSLLNGASAFLIEVELNEHECIKAVNNKDTELKLQNDFWSDFGNFIPLQINDEFFVQERDYDFGASRVPSKSKYPMTYDQSRIKDKVVSDIKIKQIQNLTMGEWFDLVAPERKYFGDIVAHSNYFNSFSKIKYEDDPYIVYIEIKDK